MSVKRHVKGKKMRVVIECPWAQKDYVTFFNTIAWNNYDSSDWSTSISEQIDTIFAFYAGYWTKWCI